MTETRDIRNIRERRRYARRLRIELRTKADRIKTIVDEMAATVEEVPLDLVVPKVGQLDLWANWLEWMEDAEASLRRDEPRE